MAEKKNDILQNGVKVVAETVVAPGMSLLLDGKIKSGLLHTGGGILAKLVLGVPGVLLVAANSYAKSVSGKGLVGNITGRGTGPVSSNSLEEIVKQDLAAGRTPDEIKAGLAEDVDDICEKA
jgi:hypothetical protein